MGNRPSTLINRVDTNDRRPKAFIIDESHGLWGNGRTFTPVIQPGEEDAGDVTSANFSQRHVGNFVKWNPCNILMKVGESVRIPDVDRSLPTWG